MIIRPTEISDAPQILKLMQQLADFEGYRNDFKVTENQLIERCFKRGEFCVIGAENQGALVGILVYYFLPFTYDLTPWMFIKELYVIDEYRGNKLGNRLMKRAAQDCAKAGGSKIVWDVLIDNHAAQNFYQSLGATANFKWQGFCLTDSALQTLALDTET